MPLVYQKMKVASNVSKISLNDYVEQLIDNIKSNVEVNLTIPTDLYTDIETAIPFGLFLNEVVASFIKSNPLNFNVKILEQPDGQHLVLCRHSGRRKVEVNNGLTFNEELMYVFCRTVKWRTSYFR